MKKIKVLLCVLLLSCSFLFADSFTLNTGISGVSNGVDGFGMGLFPAATSFSYSKSFKMIEGLPRAYFGTSISFGLGNASFSGYEWDTGIPLWSLTKEEQKGRNFYSGSYFAPNSNINIYLQQGFGKNPVTGSAPLVNLRIGFNTRYSQAWELTKLSYNKGNPVFVDSKGNPKKPFDGSLDYQAFPWLQGNRQVWNNYVYLATYWYMQKSVALNSSEGVSADVTVEYGPWWLGNNVTPKAKTSNYYKVSASLKEQLPLYVKKQADGKNWFNIVLGHSNNFSYTGGDIVPVNKITTDRLRANLSDRIWLTFTGPQFIANDCYTYFEIALNNNLYFGKVENELSNKVSAIELISSINGTFHLRLFGFMRFQYTLGYTMARGLSASYPYWSQRADIHFYVSV